MKHLTNNNQEFEFVEKIASSIIIQQLIDPNEKELIPVLGLGNESNNHEAILFWVNSSLHQMTHPDGSLISMLNENLFDELNSYLDCSQQTFTQH